MSFVAYLICAWLPLSRMDEWSRSELSGGVVTGRLLSMAEIGTLIVALSMLTVLFVPRMAAALSLAAVALCTPFWLFFTVPGLFVVVFDGEWKAPPPSPVHWDPLAMVAIALYAAVVGIGVRLLVASPGQCARLPTSR